MTSDTGSGEQLRPLNLEPIGECRVLRDVTAQPGIKTVEGTLVPLLSGAKIKSHMIVMHPGQYCFAHPHDTESIIYTVSGRWVFCTTENGEEVRTVIGEGDLFHFPGGVPTGFETPFAEGASILILKEGSAPYDEMMSDMIDAKTMLEKEAAGGEPFYFRELAEDHAARIYGREVSGQDPAGLEE